MFLQGEAVQFCVELDYYDYYDTHLKLLLLLLLQISDGSAVSSMESRDPLWEDRTNMSGTEPTLNASKKPKKLVNVVLLTGHEQQTYVDVSMRCVSLWNIITRRSILKIREMMQLADSHQQAVKEYVIIFRRSSWLMEGDLGGEGMVHKGK